MAHKNAKVNDMVFKTLSTKADKQAKHKSELEDLGYTVTNVRHTLSGTEYPSDYWVVNGLELMKPDRGAIYLSLRTGYVERLDNIKKVDFVNYFSVLDARIAKYAAMNAKGNIWQDITYYTQKREVCINPDARWSERVYETRKHHITGITEGNKTIAKYKHLKNKSTGDNVRYYGTYNEIERAERRVAEAKAKVENAMKALERAQEELAEEKCKVAEGNAELNAFLRDKGIRK